jgi:hypothetical protein
LRAVASALITAKCSCGVHQQRRRHGSAADRYFAYRAHFLKACGSFWQRRHGRASDETKSASFPQLQRRRREWHPYSTQGSTLASSLNDELQHRRASSASIGQVGHQVLLDLRIRLASVDSPGEGGKTPKSSRKRDHGESTNSSAWSHTTSVKPARGTALAHVPLGKRRRVENRLHRLLSVPR